MTERTKPMQTINRRNFITTGLRNMTLLALAGAAAGAKVMMTPAAEAADLHLINTRLNVLTLNPLRASRGQQVAVMARLTYPGKPVWPGLGGKPVQCYLKAINSLSAADVLPPQVGLTNGNGLVSFAWTVPADLSRKINKLFIPVHFFQDGQYKWSGDFIILNINR